MRTPLTPYKIGLGVVGLFTLVLVVVVLVQAGAAKQDARTDKKANSIAAKLNDYTDSHSTAPNSLKAAGVTDVPSTISYKRVSDSSYKFCATYKAASSNFNAEEVVPNILTAGYASSSSIDDYSNGGYLYLPSTHHKGANCQTITLSGSSIYSPFTSDTQSTTKTSSDQYCGQAHPAGSIDNAVVGDISTDTTPGTITTSAPTQKTYPLSASVKVFDSECDPVDTAEVLADDNVRLIFDQPNSQTVAVIIDTSF